MQYNVEDVTPIKKKISVTVDREQVDEALQKALTAYTKDVQLKGFRKGKAPKNLLKARFKKEIHNEATTELVRRYVAEIMDEIKLSPVSPYQFDGQEVEEGQPYEFFFQFEIMPTVDLPQYEKMEVRQAKATVSEEDVDKLIESMRQNMAVPEDIEEKRPPKDGESALISLQSTMDGKALPELTGEKFEAMLGKGHLIPQLEELIRKTAPGETNEENISLPEDYPDAKLAGKEIKAKVTVHSIRRIVLPEVDEEFAKKAGNFENVEAMHAAIAESFIKSRTNMNKAAAQKRLIDALMEKTSYDLPQFMVEERLERNLREFLENLQKRGGKWEELKPEVQEEIKAEMTRNSEEFVRESVFLQAVAAKEGLTVDEQDLNEFFTSTGMRMGRNPQELRRYFEEEDLMPGLNTRLLVGKALELLYDKAEVKEVPAEELEEQDQQQPDENGEKTAKEEKKPKAPRKTARKKAENAAGGKDE